MELFLRLKHWQVFMIWILGGIQLLIFMKSDFWFISFAIYIGLFFLWIYSIGRILNKNNPDLIKRINIWWTFYALSLIPFALEARNSFMGKSAYERIDSWIMTVAGFIGLMTIIKIVIYSAKTMKRAETNKDHKVIDLVSEIFLIYFFIIGIWILQPRLNKLINKK